MQFALNLRWFGKNNIYFANLVWFMELSISSQYFRNHPEISVLFFNSSVVPRNLQIPLILWVGSIFCVHNFQLRDFPYFYYFIVVPRKFQHSYTLGWFYFLRSSFSTVSRIFIIILSIPAVLRKLWFTFIAGE